MAAGFSTRRYALMLCLALAAGSCASQPAAPTGGPSSIPPASGSLHGTVRDAIPASSGAPVAGALVEIVYQSSATRSTSTAADGSYRLDSLAASEMLRMTVSRDGYVAATKVVAVSPDDTAIDVSLMPVVVAVPGVVTDASATSAPVDAAIVTIINGANAGHAFVSNAAGEFLLDGVWGEFDISVARAGFDTTTAHVNAVSRTHVAVRLRPNTTREHAGFTGELCTTEHLPPWLSCTAPFERTHLISVPRPGSLTLTLNYTYVGDYYGNSLTLDIRCGGRVVAQKKFVKGLGPSPPMVWPDNRIGTVDVALAEACAYDLRLWNFIADTKGGSQTTYRLDVEYPR